MPHGLEHFPTAANAECLVSPEADLGFVKARFAEISADQGGVVNLGPIGGDNPSYVWAGPVSLADRIATGELTNAHLRLAMEMLAMHYVPTAQYAAERCMEDRKVRGYNPKSAVSYGAPLGPQIQGATVDRAVAHRLSWLAAGRIHDPGLTLADDINMMARRPNQPFTPGAHTGDAASPDETGCASVDAQRKKLDAYKEDDLVEVVRDKTDLLLSLGRTSVQSVFYDTLVDAADVLSSVSDTYFDPRLMAALEIVRRMNPAGVPHAAGGHAAVLVAVNYVPDTTLHTSEYAATMEALTGRKITVLGFDAWYTLEQHPGPEGHILVAQAANTLTRVLDGTPHLVARKPKR